MKFFLVFFVMGTYVSFSQVDSTFVVQGKVLKPQNNGWIYFETVDLKGKSVIIDSVNIKESDAFEFKGYIINGGGNL